MKYPVFVLAIVLGIASFAPAQAWEPTAEQKTAIGQRVADFREDFESGDFKGIFSAMPQKLIDVIAEQSGVSGEELLTAMSQMMESIMAEVEIESFGMSLDDAQYLTTDTGFDYALLPTTTRMGAMGVRMEMKGHTLVLEDEGKLHLVRIEDESQIALLRMAYPAFANTTFPAGSQQIRE